MDMDRCEHYIDGDDENLLLDDENKEKKCVRCRKQINLWMNGDNTANINWTRTQQNMNGSFLNDEPTPIMSTIIDEYSGNLEDSPLLINDCYKEQDNKEFHCHDFAVQAEDGMAWKKLLSVLLLCCLFMIAELVGGYFSGSIAIMTDAAHLLSDCLGFFISLIAIWVGRKSPTKNMTFGYHRAEVMGALLSILTIWCLSGIFSFLAIRRLYNRDYEINADNMLIVASIGVIINIIMGVILHRGSCHSHSLGSNKHTHLAKNNINVRAATIHVLGDLLQSIAVLLAAIAIKCNPDAKIADPISTLIFTPIVLCTTFGVGRDSLRIIAERSPCSIANLTIDLQKVAGVKNIHNIHIWSLAPGREAVTVHLAVDQYCDRDLLLKKTTSIIHSQFNVVSCTVQIEAYNSQLINSCRKCQISQF